MTDAQINRDSDDRRLSFSAAVGTAFLAGLVLAAVTATEAISGEVAFGAFVVAVVVVSWWAAPATAVVVAFLGFLFANGFAMDTAGTLAWHGESDVARLAVMLLLAVMASLLGQHHSARRHQPDPGHSPDRVAGLPDLAVLHLLRGRSVPTSRGGRGHG